MSIERGFAAVLVSLVTSLGGAPVVLSHELDPEPVRGIGDGCSERMFEYDVKVRRSDNRVSDLETQLEEAQWAATGLNEALTKNATESAALAKTDPSETRRLSTARTTIQEELGRARLRMASLRQELLHAWETRDKLDLAGHYTCVPRYAWGLGTSGGSAVGLVGRWSIDATLRMRINQALAIAGIISWVPWQQKLVASAKEGIKPLPPGEKGPAAPHLLLFGFEFRHGRGDTGEFFYGGGAALTLEDDSRVGAMRAQLGYSYSPARQFGGSGFTMDLRLFLEPWISVGTGSNGVLFGIGVAGLVTQNSD